MTQTKTHHALIALCTKGISTIIEGFEPTHYKKSYSTTSSLNICTCTLVHNYIGYVFGYFFMNNNMVMDKPIGMVCLHASMGYCIHKITAGFSNTGKATQTTLLVSRPHPDENGCVREVIIHYLTVPSTLYGRQT